MLSKKCSTQSWYLSYQCSSHRHSTVVSFQNNTRSSLMERWKGRVALVTGASMGIGETICRLLVSHGMKVVACARSEDKLKALVNSIPDGTNLLFPIKCDLRIKSDILRMFDAIKERWGGVDVCINNAGLALGPSIIEGDSEEWENMWQVNVMALCLCTRAAVKSMRERGVDDGQIINLNSLSGQRVGKSHFYSATKYAVTALTEGIRWELRGIESHIRISTFSSKNVNIDSTPNKLTGGPLSKYDPSIGTIRNRKVIKATMK